MFVPYLLLICASTLAYVRPPLTLYDLEDAETIFEEFIKKYNKAYANEQEKQERFNIFKEKLEMVNKLRASRSGQLASFDISHFSDLTKDEFQSRYLGYKPSLTINVPEAINITMDLPDSWDWREHNAVTHVKSQGLCLSCWAFSTTGTIEGAYAIKHKSLISLSEQQLVACDKTNYACDDGNMNDALSYLQKAGGIESESEYPYEGINDTCKFDAKKVKAKIVGKKYVTFGNDNATKQALIQNGPISIAIYASDDFKSYKGGILDCPSGNESQPNHAVLLVGYGTEKGVPYWIIKNSWGATYFGEKGYIRVQQGNNPCGMDYNGGILAEVL